MTSTFARMNMVKRVYGSVETRIKPPRGCPLRVPVIQQKKKAANRV
jgi:hypothetical protein